MNEQEKQKTVWRTPNPDCPACQRKGMHTRQEFQEFHKAAGSGTEGEYSIKQEKEERNEPRKKKCWTDSSNPSESFYRG